MGEATMRQQSAVLFAVLMSAGVFLAGCGGGGAKVEAVTTTTTMGKELQDLDEAHKKGIIGDEEYEQGKKRILDRYK